jgi:hypothetical protein
VLHTRIMLSPWGFARRTRGCAPHSHHAFAMGFCQEDPGLCSGAYIFRPNGSFPLPAAQPAMREADDTTPGATAASSEVEPSVELEVVEGPLLSEARLVFSPWASITTRHGSIVCVCLCVKNTHSHAHSCAFVCARVLASDSLRSLCCLALPRSPDRRLGTAMCSPLARAQGLLALQCISTVTHQHRNE